MKLIKTETCFKDLTKSGPFNEPFNQLVIFNAGTSDIVINGQRTLPAGSQLRISLNYGEVNVTTFNFDLQVQTSANPGAKAELTYTQYLGTQDFI